MPAIYQADCWCDSCADEIRERLLAEMPPDFDEDDGRSYDSDEFPKYMGDDEESDSPQHCASGADCLECETLPSGDTIGCLLSTNLTSFGVEYAKEAVAEGGEVAEFWRERFSWIDFPTEDEED